ncbi:MAG: ABC transporter substrate-binding protein/permease [Treponema sp.]|uniref:ABC transporter substrate-binding protein/permease n=1 Tax=Treponema sp. TaxID=166 RepID=UPI002A90C9BA|nr:ABC transporter substrate-binding protein/permease [Treponema sp.]MDY6397790.1 ABC transporter substrate-binding protein/permease [Treponema sp.]
MKSVLRKAVYLAFLFFTLTFFSCKTQKTHNTNVEELPLRVGMECAYAPNNWEENQLSDTNAPIMNNPGFYAEGYDVQIARLIAESMNRKLEIVKIPWDGLLEALNRGQIDIIVSGMVDSREHKQAALFSDTYAVERTEYGLLVNGDSKFSQADSLSDLKGASIIGQRGTKLDSVIDQIPGVYHVPAVDTIPNMLDRLNRKTVDGIVINLDSAQAYQKTYPQLAIIDFPDGQGFYLDFSGICVGVDKSNPALLEEVNTALASISIEKRKDLMDMAIFKTGAKESDDNIEENAQKTTSSLLSSMIFMLKNNRSTWITGAWGTFKVSVLGTLIGFALALLLVFLRTTEIRKGDFALIRLVKKFFITLEKFYITIVRGTPMMVQACIIYYAGFSITKNLMDGAPIAEVNRAWSFFTAALITISLNTTAYLAEVLRGAIESLDKSPEEAAHVDGAGRIRIMFEIILPQALRACLPSIGNELVNNVKGSSVLNIIGFVELMFATGTVAGFYYQYLAAYCLAALIYLFMTISLTCLLNFIMLKTGIIEKKS